MYSTFRFREIGLELLNPLVSKSYSELEMF